MTEGNRKRIKNLAIHSIALSVAVGASFVLSETLWGQQGRGAAPNRSAGQQRTVSDLLREIERKAQDTQLKRGRSELPQAQQLPARQERRDLRQVQPPARQALYFEPGTDEAELEKITDQGIQQLFQLTQQFRNSPRRGELWLRLAEMYVDKARLIQSRLFNEHQKQLAEAQERGSRRMPQLDLRPAQEYNRRAVQLYEWFLRDFPQDPKVDQALFFLGYNHFEMGNINRGLEYYNRLSREFPRSPFVDESNFALGEYYFENNRWQEAATHYQKVAAKRESRLYSFALYKLAWCQFKLGQLRNAVSSLEQVIRAGRAAQGTGDREAGASRIRLANEALKDLVTFYAETGDFRRARQYFASVVGQRGVSGMVERLAYHYADRGQREAATFLFKDLIAERPTAPKAFDYQYQIITLLAGQGETPAFRQELGHWVDRFGPEGVWARANASNRELIVKSAALMETTLRNWILQQHQVAQNTRNPEVQRRAAGGYRMYFDTFKLTPKTHEMRFFFGELMFEMEEFEAAAASYLWVTENAPDSEYLEKATLNAILALEKRLPTPEEIRRIVGDTTQPLEFDRTIRAFEAASLRYFQITKDKESTIPIRYRLATLYYYYNQFDKAIPMFQQVIADSPKSEQAEFSANLILDSFNLRQDFSGLEKAAQQILAVPELAASPVGAQVTKIMQEASFSMAQEQEKAGDYLKSAESFEEFARKNPNSDLGVRAAYNAALNYEKGGNLVKAIAMYTAVLGTSGEAHAGLRRNSSRFVAALYEKTGQYSRAADAFESYANGNPRDQEAPAFYYNAAVIRDGMNFFQAAQRNYERYLELSRDANRWEALLLMGALQERQGRITQALGHYNQFMESNSPNGEAMVRSSFKIAQLNERLRRNKAASDAYARTIRIQRNLASRGENVGTAYAAEARFKQVYGTYEELRKIEIPRDPNRQAQAVNRKLALLEKLKEELRSVIAYDDGPMVVAALTVLGQALQHKAAALVNAPIPSGLNEEELQQYRAGVEEIARPFQEEAVTNFRAALESSSRMEAYNQWTIIASSELRTLRPGESRDGGERVILTKIIDWMDSLTRSAISEEITRAELEALASARMGRSEEVMVEAASRILAKDPDHLLALNSLAMFSFQQGRPGLARIILNRALEKHPNQPGLYNNLGVIELSEKNLRAAITAFRRSLDVGRDYLFGATNLASIYLEHKDYSRAIAPLEQSFRSQRANVRRGEATALEIANNFAVALTGVGEFRRARDIYKDILDNDARNIAVLYNYAILLVERLQEFDEARGVISRVKFVADDPQILRRMDQLERALR